MTAIVAVLGAIAVLLGVLGLASPARFRSMFAAMDSRTRFTLAVTVRLLAGALLWWLAEDLRHTPVMRILAAIAVFAAVVVLLMGRHRLDRLIGWWLGRGDALLRVSAVFAGLFGAYLVYVAS